MPMSAYIPLYQWRGGSQKFHGGSGYTTFGRVLMRQGTLSLADNERCAFKCFANIELSMDPATEKPADNMLFRIYDDTAAQAIVEANNSAVHWTSAGVPQSQFVVYSFFPWTEGAGPFATFPVGDSLWSLQLRPQPTAGPSYLTIHDLIVYYRIYQE